MRVGVDEVTALMVLCAGGAAGTAAARSHIEAVDPSSCDVPLKELRRLQLSVALSGVAVRFCGNTDVRPSPLLHTVAPFTIILSR